MKEKLISFKERISCLDSSYEVSIASKLARQLAVCLLINDEITDSCNPFESSQGRSYLSSERKILHIFEKKQLKVVPQWITYAPNLSIFVTWTCGRGTCDMKKPPVVSLSMELYCKSSSTANSTRNIIMLLSFKCIHSSIRQQQIPAVFRIPLNKHLSLLETPVPFSYKYPESRDKKFRKFLLSLSIASYTKNLFYLGFRI